jgi:hypothetical protein
LLHGGLDLVDYMLDLEVDLVHDLVVQVLRLLVPLTLLLLLFIKFLIEIRPLEVLKLAPKGSYFIICVLCILDLGL